MSSSAPPGLELEQDLRFQQRMWRIERSGWVLMGLLLAGALAGLFGNGPLSRATAGPDAGPLTVEFERFQRVLRPAELRLHMHARGANGEGASIWVSNSFLDRVEVERIVPAPSAQRLAPDGAWFTFARTPDKQPEVARLSYRVRSPGRLRGSVRLGDQPAVAFGALVYP